MSYYTIQPFICYEVQLILRRIGLPKERTFSYLHNKMVKVQLISFTNDFFFTDKESTFTAISVMKFARNYLLKSTHKDWYICQAKKKSIHLNTDLMLDFYNGDPDVLNRCTFLFHPIPQTDNKYKMCKNVVGPVKHPSISGQPLPHPPHLVSKTQPPALALPSCIPVCPAGTTSGASGQTTSLGSSSHVIPTKPGSPGGHFKPSSIRSKSRCLFLFLKVSKLRLFLCYSIKKQILRFRDTVMSWV